MIARRYVAAALVMSAALLSPASLGATPDFRHPRAAGDVTVYVDDHDPHLFYYPPGEIELARTSTGAPDLVLLETRYAIPGGEFHRNVLTFKVRLAGPTGDQLRAALAALVAQTGPRATLRPLVIQRMETALVYVPLGGGGAATPADTAAHTLPPAQLDGAAGDTAAGSADVYWTTRIFTIRMNDNTAQAYGQLLRSGALSVSIGYAFVANMIADDSSSPGQLSGSPEVVAALKAQLGADSAAKGGGVKRRVVRSSALPVVVDLQKWPELIKQIDIDSRSPPGYVAVDVYCYDFRDSLRAGLFAKRIEFKATSVARSQPVVAAYTFDMLHPEIHKTTVHFKYAVRLDRPYDYRVVEISDDGTETAGAWKQGSSWVEMVDITTVVAAPARDSVPGGGAALEPEATP